MRRGICHPCRKTFTDLAGLAGAVRALHPAVSQRACERIGAGDLPSRQRRTARIRRACPIHRLCADGQTAIAERVVLGDAGVLACAFSADTHHPCLGSGRGLPYSADRGKKSVNRQALDELKQQISLLDYLQAHDWRPVRQLSRGRWMGLCPLHADHKPSFLMDPGKSLFYCYGCGRGGDVIRFAEIYHEVKFPQAWRCCANGVAWRRCCSEAADFYRMQLHRHSEAVAYLHQRGVRSPEVIEHMRIGYAPGGCLRAWLMQLGYSLAALRQAGLVTSAGYDTYMHRIVFPLEGNLYGRSISASAPPHRFLPGSKGGLYGWEQVRRYPEVILVEGLFDYAVLWQAGFHNVTCSLGTI